MYVQFISPPPPIRFEIPNVLLYLWAKFWFFLTLIQHYFHQFENLEAHCRIIAIPGQYFVPLLRSEDNSSQPFIGTPWSPESSRCGVNVPPMSWSPRDPLMAVKACAGPMTPSKVISSIIFFIWTTHKFFKNTCFTDYILVIAMIQSVIFNNIVHVKHASVDRIIVLYCK